MAHLAHFLPLKNESVYVKRKSKDFGKSRAKNGPNGPHKSLTKLEKISGNLWGLRGIWGWSPSELSSLRSDADLKTGKFWWVIRCIFTCFKVNCGWSLDAF